MRTDLRRFLSTVSAAAVTGALCFGLVARVWQLQAQDSLGSYLNSGSLGGFGDAQTTGVSIGSSAPAEPTQVVSLGNSSDGQSLGSLVSGGGTVAVTPGVVIGVQPENSSTVCQDSSAAFISDGLHPLPTARVGEVLKIQRDNCFYRCTASGGWEGPVQQEVPGKGMVTCDLPTSATQTGLYQAGVSAGQTVGASGEGSLGALAAQQAAASGLSGANTAVVPGGFNDPTIPASANAIMNQVTDRASLDRLIASGQVVDLTGGQFWAQAATGPDANDCPTEATETTLWEEGGSGAAINCGAARGQTGVAAANTLAIGVGQAQTNSVWGSNVTAAPGGFNDPTIPASANAIMNQVTDRASLDRLIASGQVVDLTGGQFWAQAATGPDADDCPSEETETTPGMVVPNCAQRTAASTGAANVGKSVSAGTTYANNVGATAGTTGGTAVSSAANTAAATAQLIGALGKFSSAATAMSKNLRESYVPSLGSQLPTPPPDSMGQTPTGAVYKNIAQVMEKSQAQLQSQADQAEKAAATKTTASSTTAKPATTTTTATAAKTASGEALDDFRQKYLDTALDLFGQCDDDPCGLNSKCSWGKYQEGLAGQCGRLMVNPNIFGAEEKSQCADLPSKALSEVGVSVPRTASVWALKDLAQKNNAFLSYKTPAKDIKPGMSVTMGYDCGSSCYNQSSLKGFAHVAVVKSVTCFDPQCNQGTIETFSLNADPAIRASTFTIKNGVVGPGSTGSKSEAIPTGFIDPALFKK